jgi:hypothetical protein
MTNSKHESGFRKKFDTTPGEAAASRIIRPWKSAFIGDVSSAAFQLGLLVAGTMISRDRAKMLLHFDRLHVDDIHWSTAYEAPPDLPHGRPP